MPPPSTPPARHEAAGPAAPRAVGAAVRGVVGAVAWSALLTAGALAQNLEPRVPVEVAPGQSGAAGAPSISLSIDGACVAWSNFDSSNGGEVWIARSNGRAVVWEPPVRVDTDVFGAVKITNSGSVVQVGSNVYVFWLDARTGTMYDDVWMNMSTDGGQTFSPQDRQISDGYGGGVEVRDFRVAARPGATGDVLHVAMRVAPSGLVDEELWIVRSLDGGQTWQTPTRIAGDTTAGLDVDQFDLAVEGANLHLVWEDDSTNGLGRYSPYHVRSTDGGATFRTPTRLDVTDPTDSGNCDAPGEHGLRVRVAGQQVAIAWVEERTHPTNEEARITWSLDGGATFATDVRVGGGDPNTVDVDYLDLFLAGSKVLVALTDNRTSLGALDHLFMWRRDLSGGAATEVQLSDGDGASFPRFTGDDEQVAVVWQSDETRQSLESRVSENYGATWLPMATLEGDTAARDVDNATAAFDPGYDNLVAPYLLDSGPGGQNRVFVGGVRPPTIHPIGFEPSAPLIGFRGENLVEDNDILFLVLVSLTQAEGSFLLPDQRDTGLAFDSLMNAGFALLPSLIAPVQPNGVANTPLLINTLPPGLQFRAVGVTLDVFGATQRLTDVATITVMP
jgi:hypothetical protein